MFLKTEEQIWQQMLLILVIKYTMTLGTMQQKGP